MLALGEGQRWEGELNYISLHSCGCTTVYTFPSSLFTYIYVCVCVCVCVVFVCFFVPGPTVPCLSLPIHQSGVNSLAVWEEPEVGSHNERLLSVASGGDDGQLSVLLLRVTFPQCQSEGAEISLELLSHWSEPLAHAAPLTALQVIDRCLIVSTSPDQRVCVWSVCENGSSLRRKGTAFTHTADVAGLEVWRREGETLAAVCGQGLQLLRITSKGRDSERDGQMDTDSRKLQERLNVTYTRNGTSEQTSGEK